MFLAVFQPSAQMETPVFPRSFQCYKPSSHKVYGSILITPDNTILLVRGRRSGKWSFPKGHKKCAETYLECALRETLEETGISMDKSTPMAYHKLSVGEYFFFEVDSELEAKTQDSDEIIDARWVPLEEIADMPCNVDVNNFLDRLNRQLRRPIHD
jgi:8-oxo-dGTP pyrophosphatase MutT (NUDIX family)